jgi:hypothetical protein
MYFNAQTNEIKSIDSYHELLIAKYLNFVGYY